MTIASDKGIVLGKHYRVTSAHTNAVRVGLVVELDEDDESDIPYFRVVKPNADSGYAVGARICLNVTADSLVEIKANEGSDITFRIDRQKGSTVIELSHGLSFDQIQRIMAIMRESV